MLPLKKIYGVLHFEHTRNTAVLLGALALFADELVKLDPPEIDMKEVVRNVF